MSHMYNQRVERWVPRGTQKSDALIINGEPMVAFGADRGDGPCLSPCEPQDRDKSGNLVKLLVDLFTSNQSFKVKVNADTPVRLGMPLYLPDSFAAPAPGQVVLSTNPAVGSCWGIVFALGQRHNLGWSDALEEGAIGIGSVDAIMIPPTYGLAHVPDNPGRPYLRSEEVVTVGPGETACINHGLMQGRTVQVYHDGSPASNDLARGWTFFDPFNFTDHKTALNDGDKTSHVFNNKSIGSTGKWFGFDAGQPATVTDLVLFDWQTNGNYRALSFVVETSANGSTWDSQVTINNHDWSPNGRRIRLQSPVTARYWRVRCVSARHPDFWILTELEAYNGTRMHRQAVIGEEVCVYLASDTQTCVENLMSTTAQFKVNIS